MWVRSRSYWERVRTASTSGGSALSSGLANSSAEIRCAPSLLAKSPAAVLSRYDACGEHASAPQVVAHGTAYQDQRSQKERVGCHNPLGVHRGRPQRALYGGQRDGYGGLVDERHARSQDRCRQNPRSRLSRTERPRFARPDYTLVARLPDNAGRHRAPFRRGSRRLATVCGKHSRCRGRERRAKDELFSRPLVVSTDETTVVSPPRSPFTVERVIVPGSSAHEEGRNRSAPSSILGMFDAVVRRWA